MGINGHLHITSAWQGHQATERLRESRSPYYRKTIGFAQARPRCAKFEAVPAKVISRDARNAESLRILPGCVPNAPSTQPLYLVTAQGGGHSLARRKATTHRFETFTQAGIVASIRFDVYFCSCVFSKSRKVILAEEPVDN